MELEIFYFDTDHAIKVHDWIIENSGGLSGNREIGLLDSALEHVQNDMYYPTFEEKLRHIIFAVNGYDYCIKRFVLEMENIIVWLAEGKINDDLLLKIIKFILDDNEFDELLKLEIFEAVSTET